MSILGNLSVNDLMIGDWVYQCYEIDPDFTDHWIMYRRPATVTGICDGEVQVSGSPEGLKEYDIRPVPVTHDVLLSNGWKWKDGSAANELSICVTEGIRGWYGGLKDSDIYLVYDLCSCSMDMVLAYETGASLIKSTWKCPYVHGLQNILRTIGLRLTADEMTIKER